MNILKDWFVDGCRPAKYLVKRELRTEKYTVIMGKRTLKGAEELRSIFRCHNENVSITRLCMWPHKLKTQDEDA